MKIVTSFESEDGFIFKTEKECIFYEKDKKIKDGIKKFVEDFYFSNLTRTDLNDIFYENKDELIKILKGE